MYVILQPVLAFNLYFRYLLILISPKFNSLNKKNRAFGPVFFILTIKNIIQLIDVIDANTITIFLISRCIQSLW